MILVAAALAAAVLDWWAVARDRLTTEYLAKPLVMVLLMAAVFSAGEAPDRVVVLIALAFAFSLVGDVVLMLPDGPFEAGLGAFLVAHCFTIAALLDVGVEPGWLVVGIVIVGGVAGFLVLPIVRAASARSPVLGWAVGAYVLVLAVMAVNAVGVGHWATIAGGLLFLVSDAMLGWGRFVGPTPGGRVGVHVTYHLAQAGFATWVIVI
ncbi:MAG: lysoplasmalogenase [Acidimicrobiales bacterium]